LAEALILQVLIRLEPPLEPGPGQQLIWIKRYGCDERVQLLRRKFNELSI
jgi:hypothetical protein